MEYTFERQGFTEKYNDKGKEDIKFKFKHSFPLQPLQINAKKIHCTPKKYPCNGVRVSDIT